MKNNTIIGNALPNMPWQDRPKGSSEIIWRYDKNPVIGRRPLKVADRIFNSAIIPYQGEFIGVFRADHKNGYPNLHLGYSKDAIHWQIEEDIIHFHNEDGSPAKPIVYGYDPRLVEIDGSYYITWCNYFHGPTIGIAKTKDFKTFIQLENVFLPYNRNGVLFPRKINGHYIMLNRPSDNGHTPFGDIYLSQSPDLTYWGKHRLVMKAGHYWWRSLKIGAGPIPIETTEGWLLIYHGVCLTCTGYIYSIGAALLDINDPSRVVADCENYLLTPEEPYETVGFVPSVTFPCATLQDAATGRIAIFYGAADTYCALAFTQVDELIDYIKAHPARPMP
ncbi:MAG: glycoside hydrolase family 130 protein [candidate division KSB1 bacterium]|nr:glycoside hydrolase family 130 protein [candidate division KSB1 bacterium]MDZ7317644.1 glycoside hydrolase family 130 protein [candidate division KSB1 bacterium]MDZ7341659.1 glycoside hydrolase family 130 protein [candidate division KSB1 bacterium]